MCEDSNIEKNVYNIIKSVLEIEEADILEDTTLQELGIDSVVFIKLVIGFETQFGLRFEDSMLVVSRFLDVKSLIKYIETIYGEKEK